MLVLSENIETKQLKGQNRTNYKQLTYFSFKDILKRLKKLIWPFHSPNGNPALPLNLKQKKCFPSLFSPMQIRRQQMVFVKNAVKIDPNVSPLLRLLTKQKNV